MKIYFTRHGESQANVLHVISNRGLRHSLTPRGRDQSEGLASYLHNFHVTQIYSSPVSRAVETSTIISNQLLLNYEAVEALREFDCGVLEGRSDPAAWQQWTSIQESWVVHQNYSDHIHGGESFHDIYQRFVPFIQGLVSQYAGTQSEIVCVSHTGIYALMLPLLLVLKNVDSRLIAEYGIDFTARIVAEVSAKGLSCVEWSGHLLNTNSSLL